MWRWFISFSDILAFILLRTGEWNEKGKISRNLTTQIQAPGDKTRRQFEKRPRASDLAIRVCEGAMSSHCPINQSMHYCMMFPDFKNVSSISFIKWANYQLRMLCYQNLLCILFIFIAFKLKCVSIMPP